MSNLTLTSLTPDDGYWFGLGVFETILVKQNTAVFLDEHLNRLKKSALFLGFLPDKTSPVNGFRFGNRKFWTI